MNRLLLTLTGLTAALLIAGCATSPTAEPAAPAKTAATAPAAPVVAAPKVVDAKDAALAKKFMGQWTGKWEMPGFGEGKFVLIIASVDGADMKGEAHWFGTASGDLKWPLLSAVVKNGQFEGKQAGDTTFKLKMKGDADLDGTWLIKGFDGNLKLKR